MRKKCKCPIVLLICVMVFSQNVREFSALAVGMPGYIRDVAQITIIIYLMIKTFRHGRICAGFLTFYVAYLACMSISMYLHLNKVGIYWVMELTLALLFVNLYKIDDFLHKFKRVMFYICAFYLACYVILRSFVDVCMLPAIRGLADLGILYDHANMVSYYKAGIVYPRSWSFYREPGIYQMFIISALTLEMTMERKPSRLRIVIFSLAVLSTYSKTGYLSLAVVLLAGFFAMRNKKGIKNFYLLGGIAALPALPRMAGVVTDAFTATGRSAHSWYSRKASILSNLYLYLQNPLTGVSMGGVFNQFASVTKEQFGLVAGDLAITDNTNTILLNFAAFGTILGIMFLVSQWKGIKSLTNNELSRILFFVSLLFLYAGEAVNSTCYPYMICFIGISRYRTYEGRMAGNRRKMIGGSHIAWVAQKIRCCR